MFESEGLTYKRFYFKIDAGPGKGGNPCVYHNKDFPFELFMKWRWYFDYRAALYKVQHPRHTVDVFWGSYDFVPPAEQQIKDLKNKIISQKRKITEYKNKIKSWEKSWNKLFSIQDEDFYKKATEKIKRKEVELRESEEKMKALMFS